MLFLIAATLLALSTVCLFGLIFVGSKVETVEAYQYCVSLGVNDVWVFFGSLMATIILAYKFKNTRYDELIYPRNRYRRSNLFFNQMCPVIITFCGFVSLAYYKFAEVIELSGNHTGAVPVMIAISKIMIVVCIILVIYFLIFGVLKTIVDVSKMKKAETRTTRTVSGDSPSKTSP
jgi:hypothetical protein